ncbi:hypothetical protein AABB24_010759, partial [Solanum stoloniferum]
QKTLGRNMSQYDQVPSFAALLNRLQHLPPVDYSFMSHIKLEHSNIGEIVDEIEEEELSDEDIMEEDEEEEEEEEIVNELQTGMEYDIHLLDQGNQQTSGRPTRTARMQVNTNYIRYNIQVPQSILDDIYIVMKLKTKKKKKRWWRKTILMSLWIKICLMSILKEVHVMLLVLWT